MRLRIFVGVILGIVIGFFLSSWTPRSLWQATPTDRESVGNSKGDHQNSEPNNATETRNPETQPDFESLSGRTTEPSTHSDLPAAKISGRVFDTAGRPFPSAGIQAKVTALDGSIGSNADYATRSSPTGYFELANLQPKVSYQLTAFDPETQDWEHAGDKPVTIRAPASGISLVVESCFLEIEIDAPRCAHVEGFGSDRIEASIHIRFERGGSFETSGSHPSRFRIPVEPDSPTSITISAKSCRPVTLTDLSVPRLEGRRKVNILLVEVGRGNALRLDINDARGAPVSEIHFADMTADPRADDALGRGRFRWAARIQSADLRKSENGTFEIKDLEAGARKIILDPGRESFLLPQMLRIDIPAEGEVRERVSLRLGGRLKISSRPDSEVQGNVLFFIRGRTKPGEDLGWVLRSKSGHDENSLTRSVIAGESYDMPGAVESGDYVLVLYGAGSERPFDFSIVRGEVTEIQLR